MTEEADQTNERLRIVFMGTPESAAFTLRAVVEAGFPVPLAITRPDRPRGRGGKVSPSPLKRAAAELGIPVIQPENVNDEESLERIRQTGLDVLLVVAFGRILKQSVLDAPRLLPLNLHFSLLPEYRGAAPVAKAILEGRTETGVTLQRIVKKLDAGPVLNSERCPIGAEETAGELMERLTTLGARLTVETLRDIRGDRWEETPQDPERVSFAPMLSKSDGIVVWTSRAERIHCLVRAMDPWPGASTVFAGASRGKAVRVTLLRCRVADLPVGDHEPGEVVEARKDGILVATGERGLLVTSLKPAGKRALTAAEFRNGYRVAPGDRFSAE